jgi:hypothetical protein
MFSRFREATARRGRKSPAVAAFTLLVGLIASHPALATSIKRLGLGEIVEASDTIVQGRVDAIRSFWQDRQIYTEVRVAVARSLKGKHQDRLTFLQVGGRVDSPVPLEMTVPGAPMYRVGEEAYFFLQPGRPGERIVVGLFQGHVPVRRDAQGDYVGSPGARKSPAQFDEEIRRHLAGQRPDRTVRRP